MITLFVTGLPYDLDNAELEEIFEKFGKITSAKVVMDRDTNKSKGFGFVVMENREEGLEAIEMLKDISLGKKPLIVKEAENRPVQPRDNSRSYGASSGGFKPRTPRPGGYQSGGSQGGGSQSGSYRPRTYDNPRPPRDNQSNRYD